MEALLENLLEANRLGLPERFATPAPDLRKRDVVNVAVQGLVHSKDELRHAT